MLRASSEKEQVKVNLQSVVDRTTEPGVEHGDLLRALTEATIEMRLGDLTEVRKEAVEKMGTTATVDALAVASGFNGITRVADATGIPIDDYENDVGRQIREATGINDFDYESKSKLYD